jgi:hypothetical protein
VGVLRRRDHAAFWAWFAEAAPAVRGPQDLDTAFLGQVQRRLGAVDRRLDYEIGLRPATDELELVISAGGRDRVAPIVLEMTAAAPDVPGWRVAAFRPARDVAGAAVRVHDEIVTDTDVWVAVAGAGRDLVLTAHVRDLERNVTDRMRAAHLMVEQAVGERVLVERVAGLEWRAFVGDPPEGLVPLAGLRAALPDA